MVRTTTSYMIINRHRPGLYFFLKMYLLYSIFIIIIIEKKGIRKQQEGPCYYPPNRAGGDSDENENIWKQNKKK